MCGGKDEARGGERREGDGFDRVLFRVEGRRGLFFYSFFFSSFFPLFFFGERGEQGRTFCLIFLFCMILRFRKGRTYIHT